VGLSESARHSRRPPLPATAGHSHMDGVDVVVRLREWMTRPLIILSARDSEADKVNALDAGADPVDRLSVPAVPGRQL